MARSNLEFKKERPTEPGEYWLFGSETKFYTKPDGSKDWKFVRVRVNVRRLSDGFLHVYNDRKFMMVRLDHQMFNACEWAPYKANKKEG
jgi:hypothetical protein